MHAALTRLGLKNEGAPPVATLLIAERRWR